jgi:Stress responsive A/B Barrel Domain
MCCLSRLPMYFFGASFLVLGCAWLATKPTNAGDNSILSESAPAAKDETTKVNQSKLLRHVVLFQFKEASSEAEITKVVQAFRDLPKKIEAIAGFEWGINNSPEGLNDGLTHGFIVTFKSEKDRDSYLTHPAHQAFVEVLKPHLKRPLVLDFWAAE